MEQNETKIFKIKYGAKIILLCSLIFALCSAGIAVSIVRMVRYGIHGLNDVIKYPFLILVCLFCIIIVIALLIRSTYEVTSSDFITRFGFIKTKYPVKELTKIEYDKESKKLWIYNGEAFAVITLYPEWTDAFIEALRAANPQIEYALKETPSKKDE
ncbi:MAG: PH domain-containing protein [Clostridia bacterium]|nr:PH domain-containing protein [Clostridia bacterium]